jgi:hypothetical protein
MRSLGIRRAGNRNKLLQPSKIGLELTPILSASDAALRERVSLCYLGPDGRAQTRGSLMRNTGLLGVSPMSPVPTTSSSLTLSGNEECRLPFQSLDTRSKVGSA